MTAPARVTHRLDLTDPAQIEAYERAFYAGFAHATHNRLVRWLWDWDHEAKRLRAKIPYAEQTIWVAFDTSGAVVDAVAVNVKLRALQAAAYGFAVPTELATAAAAGRVCEFITFFAVGGHELAIKRVLWRELFDDLRAAGFTHALGTGSPKIFPIHRWMGATKVGETKIEDEIRNFLSFDLTRTGRA